MATRRKPMTNLLCILPLLMISVLGLMELTSTAAEPVQVPAWTGVERIGPPNQNVRDVAPNSFHIPVRPLGA
ncbi:MAG: hypothetical protein JSU70_01820 [Phycisphaerales bacterium]|nr:MAG: hypothetical protein JSU70_01820 [Phycisphaerales bacterium]